MSETGDIRIDNIMPHLSNRWITLPFEECLDNRDIKFKKLKKKDIKPEGIYPVIDQGENFISGYIDNEADLFFGPLPAIIFGDHTRRIKFIDFQFAVGADGTKILHPFEFLNQRFFYYYLRSLNIESQGYSRHYRFLKAIDVPVPSLNEQRRIVAKLELLLAKVEACQERLNKIPAILKRFRQSVLAAACSGRLTADWKNENHNGHNGHPSSWNNVKLSNFIESMRNGIYKPEKFYATEGTICLRMYNIQNGQIVWKNLKRMNLTSEEISQYALKAGDILVNRVNSRELVGKAAIIDQINEPVIFESKNIRLRTEKEMIISRYVNYCFMTRIVRDVFEDIAKQTVGMATISQPQIANLVLPIPKIEEQHEIVRRVEALFKIADQIEDRYKKAKTHVDKLAQSILAKAFRGELVPQDPNDEPASESLEKIKDERNNDKGKSSDLRTSKRNSKKRDRFHVRDK